MLTTFRCGSYFRVPFTREASKFDSQGSGQDNLVTEGMVERWDAKDGQHPTWVLLMDYLKHPLAITDQPVGLVNFVTDILL